MRETDFEAGRAGLCGAAQGLRLPMPASGNAMVVDQNELDAMTQAAAAPSETLAPATESPARSTPQAGGGPMPARPPELQRILRLSVPVIAQLAARQLPVSRVRRLSLGTIIEFEQSIETRLQLLVNNRAIGSGEAVKVGENFGLRIDQISTPADRIRSLAK